MAVLEIKHVLSKQMIEYAGLHRRHYSISGARQDHQRPISRKAAQDEQPEDHKSEQTHLGKSFSRGHAVEHGPQQRGGERRRPGAHRQHQGAGGIGEFVLQAVIAQKTRQHGEGAGGRPITWSIEHRPLLMPRRRKGKLDLQPGGEVAAPIGALGKRPSSQPRAPRHVAVKTESAAALSRGTPA